MADILVMENTILVERPNGDLSEEDYLDDVHDDGDIKEYGDDDDDDNNYSDFSSMIPYISSSQMNPVWQVKNYNQLWFKFRLRGHGCGEVSGW